MYDRQGEGATQLSLRHYLFWRRIWPESCVQGGCHWHGDGPPQLHTGVIRDSAGNLYGTAQFGGSGGSDAGVAFKLDTAGKEKVLKNFTGGADGGRPTSGAIRDLAGNLYGTAGFGGIGSCEPDGCGVVFKLKP